MYRYIYIYIFFSLPKLKLQKVLAAFPHFFLNQHFKSTILVFLRGGMEDEETLLG